MKKKFTKIFSLFFFFFVSTTSLAQIKEEVEKIKTSSKLVLVGETHNIEFNEEFQLALINHLKNTNELKYVLLEHSYAGAFLYNRFLETGDTSLICQDFYFNSTIEKRDFWKRIYDLNKTYSSKLHLIGVDHDRSFPYVKVLNLILSELVYQDKFLLKLKLQTEQFLSEIPNPEKTNYAQYQKIKRGFNSFFESSSTAYLKEVLGGYYSDLSLIYHNQHPKERDRNTNKKFYKNLSRIITEKKLNTKDYSFLGIFGAAHCASNKRSFSNIAYHNKGIFHKDVSTIMIHYGKVYKDGVKYYENTGLEVISKKSAKNLGRMDVEEDNFRLLHSSTVHSKPSKYDHHFKYAFYVKSSSLQLKNRFECN